MQETIDRGERNETKENLIVFHDGDSLFKYPSVSLFN